MNNTQAAIAGVYLRPTKYLYFEQATNPGRKTGVWNVRSVGSGAHLGAIRWHGPWRQYCFWPKDATLFNGECLLALEDRLGTCNRVQRNIRENTRALTLATLSPPSPPVSSSPCVSVDAGGNT